MNKNEIVVEILNVFDENTRLKIENERLKIEKERLNNSRECNNKSLSDVEQTFIEIGKKYLLDKVVYSYNSIDVSKDDNDNICVTTFEKWLERNLKKEYIPSTISCNEFIDFVKDDLKKNYDKKVKEALKDAGYDE